MEISGVGFDIATAPLIAVGSTSAHMENPASFAVLFGASPVKFVSGQSQKNYSTAAITGKPTQLSTAGVIWRLGR